MKRPDNLKNTIIYGGAFNPPTRAHLAILQACVDRAESTNADVWLLPSGNRSDKTIDVTRDDRLNMLDALTKDIVSRTTRIHIETSELDKTVQTETFDTVLHFDQTYPDRKFIWVFGSDSVETMLDWYMGEWMVENLSMPIVERPGTPVRKLGRFATRLPVTTTEMSSTEVRRRMAAHESLDDLVTPSVLELLVK